MAINKIILNDVEIELSDEQARRIIGSGNLSTVAQNLVGGVNEINAKVGNGVLTTDNKALIGGVNEINEKISAINGDIVTINETISNMSGGNSDVMFKTVFGSSSLLNQDIPPKESYTFNFGLSAYESLFEGYTPFGFTRAFADNGIQVVAWKYNSSTKNLEVDLYNPFSTITNSGTVRLTPLFIKNGALQLS